MRASFSLQLIYSLNTYLNLMSAPSQSAQTPPSIPVLKILDPDQSPVPATLGPSSGPDSIKTAQTSAPGQPVLSRRPNGKIARLPREIRDKINLMLQDGLSYPAILQQLQNSTPPLPYPISEMNLSRWKDGAHQDWLLQREWLERLASKSEFSTDILAAPNSSAIHEAALRIATAQMFDQLMRFSAAMNTAGSTDQPETEKLARLVNALSRLTREALAFQKYRDATTNAVQGKCPNSSDEVSEEQRQMILDYADDILGAKAYRRRRDPKPSVEQRAPPAAPTVGQCLSPGASHSLSASQGGQLLQHNRSSQSSEALPEILPLPEGEGRGEGEATGELERCTKTEMHLVSPVSVPTSTSDSPADSNSATPNTPDEHPATPIPAPPVAPPEPPVELCRGCGAPLPPLLPSGERPNRYCTASCGTPAPPPPSPHSGDTT